VTWVTGRSVILADSEPRQYQISLNQAEPGPGIADFIPQMGILTQGRAQREITHPSGALLRHRFGLQPQHPDGSKTHVSALDGQCHS
jgi:hypothetical protein